MLQLPLCHSTAYHRCLLMCGIVLSAVLLLAVAPVCTVAHTAVLPVKVRHDSETDDLAAINCTLHTAAECPVDRCHVVHDPPYFMSHHHCVNMCELLNETTCTPNRGCNFYGSSVGCQRMCVFYDKNSCPTRGGRCELVEYGTELKCRSVCSYEDDAACHVWDLPDCQFSLRLDHCLSYDGMCDDLSDFCHVSPRINRMVRNDCGTIRNSLCLREDNIYTNGCRWFGTGCQTDCNFIPSINGSCPTSLCTEDAHGGCQYPCDYWYSNISACNADNYCTWDAAAGRCSPVQCRRVDKSKCELNAYCFTMIAEVSTECSTDCSFLDQNSCVPEVGCSYLSETYGCNPLCSTLYNCQLSPICQLDPDSGRCIVACDALHLEACTASSDCAIIGTECVLKGTNDFGQRCREFNVSQCPVGHGCIQASEMWTCVSSCLGNVSTPTDDARRNVPCDTQGCDRYGKLGCRPSCSLFSDHHCIGQAHCQWNNDANRCVTSSTACGASLDGTSCADIPGCFYDQVQRKCLGSRISADNNIPLVIYGIIGGAVGLVLFGLMMFAIHLRRTRHHQRATQAQPDDSAMISD